MKRMQNVWARRAASFTIAVLVIYVLGGLLGSLVFPLAGRLGGSTKSIMDLSVLGAKSGSFFFLVWAPGLALVREFMRAEREKRMNRYER